MILQLATKKIYIYRRQQLSARRISKHFMNHHSKQITLNKDISGLKYSKY